MELERGRRLLAERLVSFLLAILIVFSVSSFDAGHAHAGIGFEVNVTVENYPIGNFEIHDHAAPCDDNGTKRNQQDSCCLSFPSCGVWGPISSDGFVLLSRTTPVAYTASPALLRRDPPTLHRPPRIIATA